MAGVALDADVVIGFLDPGDAQHDRAVAAMRLALASGPPLIMGASVLGEILVHPLRRGVVEHVDRFLAAAPVAVVPVDEAVAREAARLRARHRALRLPDALCLAVARGREARLVTLDERLARLAPG